MGWLLQQALRVGSAMQDEFGKGRRYTYKGGYFEMREQVKQGAAEWEDCPDLFGDGPGAGVYP